MTITSLTSPPQEVSQDFNYAEVTKAVPKALWGTDFNPDIGASDATVSVVTGFSISPSVVGSAGLPQPRNIDDFSYDVTPHNAAYAWDTSPAFPLSPDDETGRFAAIKADTASNRAALLSALGYNDAEDVDLHDAVDAPNNVFLVAPQVVAV